jgi:hypothetical protein
MRLAFLTGLVAVSAFYYIIGLIYVNVFTRDYHDSLMIKLCEYKFSWILTIQTYYTFVGCADGVFISLFVASGKLFRQELKDM